MRKLKELRGITLVALVVTIIILLILAGVTISQLTSNGLFENTKLAQEKHENAQSKEQDVLKEYESLINSGRDTVTIDRSELEGLINTAVQTKMNEISNSSDVCPTGTIIAYYGNTAPTGYLKCDGTSYNISDYTVLAALINTTTGSYGTEEAGKFKVPNLTGKFLKGNTSAGASEDAGLPNITGGPIRSDDWTEYSSTASGSNGAFSWNLEPYYANWTNSSSGTHNFMSEVYFDASKSNTIYGKSTTVTPENISVVYCIKF